MKPKIFMIHEGYLIKFPRQQKIFKFLEMAGHVCHGKDRSGAFSLVPVKLLNHDQKETHTLWKHPTSFLSSRFLRFLPWHLHQWRHQWTPRAILLKGPLKSMTLTYKLDLDILPLDLHAKNQDCLFVRLPARVVTDRQTHTQTHRQTMSKLLQPSRQRRGV